MLYILFLMFSDNCIASHGMVFYFLFFKQKTAYEMRISDWSSDVCSSDLPAAPRAGCRPPVSPAATGSADPIFLVAVNSFFTPDPLAMDQWGKVAQNP